jgi:hypothetical protein
MDVDPVHVAGRAKPNPRRAHSGEAFRAFLIAAAQLVADVSAFAEGREQRATGTDTWKKGGESLGDHQHRSTILINAYFII